jgi:hypothetical protein
MFRKELRELQPRLFGYEKAFKALSEGYQVKVEWLEPDIATTDDLLSEWRHSAKTAHLGEQPLKAGIGPQVPVHGGFRNAVATADIDRKEHEFILGRRDLRHPQHRSGAEKLFDAIGLALSGGGIRSATFCLGVAQVLARMRLLGEIDYLSTVSGGGYFGSFLSSCLGPSQGGRPPVTKESIDHLIAETFKHDNSGVEAAAVSHLRHNSERLLYGGLKAAGLIAFGLITNLLMILPVALLAVLVIWGLNLIGFWGDPPSQEETLHSVAGWFFMVVLGSLFFFSISLPAIRKKTLGQPPNSKSARLRQFWTSATLVLALLAVVIPVSFVLPAVFRGYGMLRDQLNHYESPLFRMNSENGILALLAALPFFLGVGLGFFKQQWISNLLVWLLVLSGPLFYGWVVLLVGAKIGLADPAEWDWRWLGIVTALWWQFSRFLLNLNTLGPHRYCRDRLRKCFLVYRDALQKLRVRQQLRLTEMRTSGAAPYHLINTVVNLPRSDNPELRGRKGDFFILSPFFCGSPTCGYVDTSHLERADPHLDLGTAMAISGVEAFMGTRWRKLPIFRFLMAVLNVRLGYWFPNVNRLDRLRFRGVGLNYFLAEITGRIQENMNYVNISDGAHIDHLGVYELLRRRCKFIICVHGDAPLKTESSDLQRLARYAINDLGIKLEYNLADLQPDKDGMSRAYAILIKILYEPKEDGSDGIGWMIYLKPALTGFEPPDVLDYRHRNPGFPDEGMVDQVFGEEQFDAYRALGQCATESLFTEELMGYTPPATVRAWFQKLADNLLPDNDAAFLARRYARTSDP